MVDITKEILFSEKEFTDISYKRSKKDLFISKIDYDGNTFLTVNSLIEVNN